jgi:DNA repair protein RadA/Sms
MLLAVLERRANVSCANLEVYVSVVGGIRLSDPGSDLGVCLAIASAVADRPVKQDLAAIGEVGLGGEVRHVPHLERRIAEAERLGFRTVIVPANSKIPTTKASVVRATTLSEALTHAM